MSPVINFNSEAHYPVTISDWPFICEKEKKDLQNTYESITDLNLWEFLQQNDPPQNMGFMFWNNEYINQIASHPKNTCHSAASFAITMRIMQKIARIGFEQFCTEFSSTI
jgi:hypothetical protein